RDGNHRLRNFFPEPHLRVGPQLRKNHGRNLRGTELLGFAFDFNLDAGVAIGTGNDLVRDALALLFNLRILAAHEPLDGINRVPRISDSLALGSVADQPLPGLCESHYGRRYSPTLGILKHDWFATFHDRHA